MPSSTGNSLAMVALRPDTVTLNATLWTANTVLVSFPPPARPLTAWPSGLPLTTGTPSIRSRRQTWPSLDPVPIRRITTFYISAAAVDANGTESQFSTEWTLSTGMEVLAYTPDSLRPPPPPASYYGIQLLPNRPNPFDESTLITITSGTDLFADRACLLITGIDGHVMSRIPVPLQKGTNQVIYDHGFGASGIYICTLFIDGLPLQSTKMIFSKR